jgi:hypothetical protein
MWGGPPPAMTPEQMAQMMQMQAWWQAQQQMVMGAPPMGMAPMGQPVAQPAAPATAEAPAQLMTTNVVLVKPASRDGDLVCAEGQRTSVAIKVELDGAREPAGTYATAKSLREKAALSFPLDGSGWSWKLYVGQMVDNQPANVAIVAGDSDAVSDSSWRELFSCQVIDGLKPVVFAQPCLAGHEGRDVDRKRKASMVLEVESAEVQAAAQALSNAHPARHGMGSSGAGKAVVQLEADAKVVRLHALLQAQVEMSRTVKFLHKHDSKPIFILTDGVWTKPVFTEDRSKMVTAGSFRELKVTASLAAACLNDDGTLKRGVLFWACRCCPPQAPHPKASSSSNAVVSTTPTWQKSEVTMEASAGGHKSANKDGGINLKSFQSTVKYHHDKFHGGGSISADKRQKMQANFFAIGSAVLQQPAAQQALQEAAAVQSEVEQTPTLTPADPPESAPIALRYPFDAPSDAKERDFAEVRLEDITTAKLADGAMVSWRVFDLLRRYELQCAINTGLSSEQVMVMPPYDFLQIDRQVVLFQEKNDVVIDLSTRVGSTFPVFQLFSSLQAQVGLTPSFSSRSIQPSLEVSQPAFHVEHGLCHPFGELQFVSIPVLSSVHNSEYIWLTRLDVAFSLDSYPELHSLHVARLHAFVQHVACSTIELVPVAVPHQPKEGAQKNVCVFSSALFLQLALKLLKQHGPTPALVQALRELTVEESDYHKRRKQAAKDIRSLHSEYCRMKQEARIKEREAAKAAKAAGQPGTSAA